MASHAIGGTEHEVENYLEVKSRYSGIFSWIFSVDHKRIGIMYLVAMFVFFLVGIMLGFFMRLEQISMGETVMTAQTYNKLFTLHGVIMIFLFIIPGITATFGNFFLPIQIGAKDVAFPRLNLFSWWLYIAGATIALLAIFTGTGMADTGWTFYVPYSVRTGSNVTLAVFAAFVLGFSSILTGLNFVTTVHRMRAPGMGWFRMPLFIWGLYSTAWIQVLATPVVGITLLLIIVERTLHIGIFDPALGGDPILFQHMFWIYSHPAVYLMVLPGMGVVSEIIPTFARRTIFGYKAIAYSSVGIALVGTLVWGHHMYVSGQSYTAGVIFSFLTFFVAIPTAMPEVPLIRRLGILVGRTVGSSRESSKLSWKSTVLLSISDRVSSAIFLSLASVYLIAAGLSPSTDPKLPCPSISGYLSDHSCAIRTIAS